MRALGPGDILPVQRVALSCHVRPESMRTWFGEEGRTPGSTLCGVQFEVDALTQCTIQLFDPGQVWGVSAGCQG